MKQAFPKQGTRKELEERLGIDLEQFLREAYEGRESLEKIATDLGISKSEALGWMQICGIIFRDVAKNMLESLLVGYIEGRSLKQEDEGEVTMARVNRSFFGRDPRIVAKELLGRYIHAELPNEMVVTVRLREIAAYEGTTKTTSPGILYAPGLISISRKFGQSLIDIATGKEDEPSCVTLRGGELLGMVAKGKRFESTSKPEPIHGPGNLAKILGITKDTCDLYEGKSVAGRIIWIDGNNIHASDIKHKKGNSKNCKGIYLF